MILEAAAPIYLVAQIREIESIARQRYGFSDGELMQRAGQAALRCLHQMWPAAKKIAIICGPGNNGGDGYVLAYLAAANGLQVQVQYVGELAQLKNAAAAAYDACQHAGISIQPFKDDANLAAADVVVDAIYGIGFHGEITHPVAQVVAAINNNRVPVLALDVPSGVNADTGKTESVAIKATVTITFLGLKIGLMTGNGLDHAGKLISDTLQLPSEIAALIEAKVETLTLPSLSHYLKPRPNEINKGRLGHVLVIGGEPGHSGAPLLAAMAALRVGAGLVTIATHPAHATVLNLTCPEIMCHAISRLSSLILLIEKATTIVIGPGLGQSTWSKRLFIAACASGRPLIVDADGLNLLAKQSQAQHNWILTPHPGEAARLLQTTITDIQSDRLAAVQKLQQHYEGIAILKGAGTLISGSHHLPALCTAGNPGMASAGMGDLLSGVIAGLVAQGIPLFQAAKLGVLLHALAGDQAASTHGERGLIATDLLLPLRHLVNPTSVQSGTASP